MKKITLLLLCIVALVSCKKEVKDKNAKLNVVTTTSMLTDLVATIGGDAITLNGLMGSGVDPHLYKASEGDVTKLMNADIIIYNGLHLEGKLVEVFEKMEHQNHKTIAVADGINKNNFISSEYFASSYDPHIWFDINIWKQVTQFTITALQEADPKNAELFETNGKEYLATLSALHKKVANTIATLPKEQRILVTAHDAFNYFGKAYDFNVVGLQGLSTATEAGVQDVQKLAHFIIENKVKAIFIESSVPKRTVEALQASVQSKGHDLKIGGTLYSDALGNPGTPEGTYAGMFEYNVNTIINALQ